MDPTTLVTFLFRAPAEIRTVELLGSWDNFERPYRMHHDRLRGSGFWSGCFKFENIIFDGDEINWAKPRQGGLKQGGTYWYYYRLNYDTDAHDDRQPHTTHCPLLPGQQVNIIEVPIEVVQPPSRSHSAYGYSDIVGSLTNLANLQTLDPTDKYAMLEPPPRSKVHARCSSDDALDGRLENGPSIVVHDAGSPMSPPQSYQAGSVSPQSRSANHLHEDMHEDMHERRVFSGASSVYSRASSMSDAASQLSAISEMSVTSLKHEDEVDGIQEDELPDFPYPCTAGPAPLASLEALGPALFDSAMTLPAEPSRPRSEEVEEHQHQRRSSAYTCGPESIANVQFYGSRPGTSLDEDPDQYRPRMYSLPNMELREYSDESSPGSPTSMLSQRNSNELDENPTPGDEAFDLMSPTFTATTLSTGGNNTPFRLSAQTSPEEIEHAYNDAQRHAFDETDDQRSMRQSRSGSNNSSRPSFFERTMARLSPPSFMNYSLPCSATESDNSLAKTVSLPSGQTTSGRELSLPSMFTSEEHSMVDAIFSELGI